MEQTFLQRPVVIFDLIHAVLNLLNRNWRKRGLLFSIVATISSVNLFVTLKRERVNNWFWCWKRDHWKRKRYRLAMDFIQNLEMKMGFGPHVRFSNPLAKYRNVINFRSNKCHNQNRKDKSTKSKYHWHNSTSQAMASMVRAGCNYMICKTSIYGKFSFLIFVIKITRRCQRTTARFYIR